MKVNDNKVGSEVEIEVNGKLLTIDEVVDGIAYCIDEDGGEIAVRLKK